MMDHPIPYVRYRSLPTRPTDTAARALAALAMRNGGTLTLTADELLDAPAYLTLITSENGVLTFTGVPDPDRLNAATIWFDRDIKAQLTQWTLDQVGGELHLTGFLTPSGAWPAVGNTVSIMRMDIPGRGGLEEITARVAITNLAERIVLTVMFPFSALEGS